MIVFKKIFKEWDRQVFNNKFLVDNYNKTGVVLKEYKTIIW